MTNYEKFPLPGPKPVEVTRAKMIRAQEKIHAKKMANTVSYYKKVRKLIDEDAELGGSNCCTLISTTKVIGEKLVLMLVEDGYTAYLTSNRLTIKW